MTISENDQIVASYGIILLAAGASSRLGKPKQLLLYKGRTFLQHMTEVAADTGAKSIIIVLGAGANLLVNEIKNKNVDVIINQEWEGGMASSIRCGLKKLLEIVPGVDAAIIMVSDQPFVTTKLLENLLAKYKETGKPIIASSYENNMGTPALFDKTIFAALMALKGDAGAKRIMKENPGWVSLVNFPLGKIDIDTEKDYQVLLKSPPPPPNAKT